MGTAYSRENAIFRLAWHRVLSTRLYYFVKTNTNRIPRRKKKGTTIILLEALAGNGDFSRSRLAAVNKRKEILERRDLPFSYFFVKKFSFF